MPVLTESSHAHHARLVPHVDQLVVTAEMVGKVPAAVLVERLDEDHRFIVGQLVPHMEAAERGLYPALERLLQDTRSMKPMRDEHARLRRLIGELGRLHGRLHAGDFGRGEEFALRRILYRMYAILKVHLAEEEHYLPVLEHNLSDEETATLARALEHATAEPL